MLSHRRDTSAGLRGPSDPEYACDLDFKQNAYPTSMPFDAELRAVVCQHLTVTASYKVYARFQALFPNGKPTESLLVRVHIDTLMSVGLSSRKARAVRRIAMCSLRSNADARS